MIHRVQKDTQWATTDAYIAVDLSCQKLNIAIAFRHDILASYHLRHLSQILTLFVPLPFALHPSPLVLVVKHVVSFPQKFTQLIRHFHPVLIMYVAMFLCVFYRTVSIF